MLFLGANVYMLVCLQGPRGSEEVAAGRQMTFLYLAGWSLLCLLLLNVLPFVAVVLDFLIFIKLYNRYRMI